MFQGAKILFVVLILSSVLRCLAQPLQLIIIPTDTVLIEFNHPQSFVNETQISKYLQKELMRWQKQNFLEAAFDSILHDSLKTRAYLHLGHRYKIYEENPNANKREKKQFDNNASHYMYWIKSIESTLRSLEQNGYPFAMVSVKSKSLSGKNLEIQLIIDSGRYVTYDSLIITGNSMQDKLFLMRYLDLKPNTAYNEENIRQIDKHLQQLPFIKVARPAAVYFYKNKAQVIICIDDKPSNNFEGIAGIQSDENNPGKYKITGDVNLQLNNVLASAATLKLQWRKFAAQNSDINVSGYYPYVFGAPIALSDEFSLFRQDSNFQRLKNNFGFSYLFSGLNAFQFYYSYEKSTATLSVQQQLEALTFNTLPTVNDYLNKSYGVKLLFRNLDNLFNPHQGINMVLDVNTGTHKVLENALLKNALTSSGQPYTVYNNLPKQQTTMQAYTMIDLYYQVSKRNVLNLFTQGAVMNHPQILFNEQYQLGGLRTFRGVNELSIKATSYAMLRTEYRYILPQTGYFNLFCNGIWYESNIVNSYKKNALLGAGGGLGIQTKGGILTVVYALANENGFVLKQGKVHVGFTAVF
jgi:hypothetical protein